MTVELTTQEVMDAIESVKSQNKKLENLVSSLQKQGKQEQMLYFMGEMERFVALEKKFMNLLK